MEIASALAVKWDWTGNEKAAVSEPLCAPAGKCVSDRARVVHPPTREAW
jgi:hypothetical protein